MKITNLQTTAQAAERLKPVAAITGGLGKLDRVSILEW